MNAALFYTGMVVAAILMGVSLIYAVIYRRERAVRYFVWLMACRLIYAGGVIMELQADALPGKEGFRSIQQIALVLSVPLFILFVLDLYNRDKWRKISSHLIIFGPFVGWAIVVATDFRTGLIYASKQLVNGHLETVRTPLALSVNLLCFTIIATGLVFVVRYIRSARPEVRKAGMWVLVLCCIPVLFELAKLTVPDLQIWLLPISVYTGFLGMIMLWLVVRNRLFSIVPMARQQIIDTQREGFLIADHNGRIVDHNGYVQPLLLDSEAGSLIGLYLNDVLSVWPEWKEACLQMRTERMEIRGGGRLPDRVFILDVYPLLSQRGRKHGTVSVLFDITEKQRHLEQIASLNQLKDQLFTVVSHDIRDPLALQVSLIELLEESRHSLQSDQRELVDTLSEQIRNTYTMAENLLEWFRVQKEGFSLRADGFDLSQIVREACRSLTLRSEVKQVRLVNEVPDHFRIHADREAILLIVRNLLSNAIKFSRRGGTVLIRAQEEKGEWLLAVRDDGIGMDDTQLRLLFDDASLDTLPGTEGEKGAGLGLMVSRRFLQLSGGRLRVESAPGKGSTFYIHLPKEGGRSNEGADPGR